MKIEIDGKKISSEPMFHDAIVSALKLPDYYGRNLDALFDVLSTDVERPLVIVWNESIVSQELIGAKFNVIVEVLRRVERQDIEWGIAEKFKLLLN